MKSKYLIISLFIFIILSCNKTTENKDFKKFTQDYFIEKLKLFPLEATQNNFNDYNDQLNLEMTDDYISQIKKYYSAYNIRLKSFAINELTTEEQNSFKIIQWETERGLEFVKLPIQYMPLQQFWGTHLTISQFGSGESAQPFKTEKDYRNWLKRLEKYTVWLDSAKVKMKQGMGKNIVIPKTLCKKLIPQFTAMISKDAESNFFYAPIKKLPNNFSKTTKDSLIKDYKILIEQKVIPAYTKMADFIKNEYYISCRNTSGYGDLPNGNEIYNYYVKYWTTTNTTPEDIHQIGLNEVKRILSEMEKVKNIVGFKGTIKEFFVEVRNKKELKPFTKPEQVITNFERIHKTIGPNVNKLFNIQPKTKFQIKRTESFREQTASAEYQQGATDGTRPGIFYVPIPNVLDYNIYGDEDLFLHEAIPGHHYQISLQQENEKLPDFRKFLWFGAYGEGWALYTESLGNELGLYKDPYQYFGMLGNEMHRSIRLVVDTGIHSKGWTREQAIKYSLDNEAESEASITAEIERYMAIPGQALSYKTGQMKIKELRKNAEKKKKKKFDIKEFHKQILESGVMPLALLDEKINNWIKNSK